MSGRKGESRSECKVKHGPHLRGRGRAVSVVELSRQLSGSLHLGSGVGKCGGEGEGGALRLACDASPFTTHHDHHHHKTTTPPPPNRNQVTTHTAPAPHHHTPSTTRPPPPPPPHSRRPIRSTMTSSHFQSYMDKRVMVKLNGGRVVEGTLRGFDPFMNLVVDEGVEVRKASDRVRIGVCVIRGSSIIMLEALDRIS